MHYQLTFNTIVCKLPSSGIDISAAEAAANALEFSSKIAEYGEIVCDLAGPEAEPVGVAFSVISALTDLGGAIDNLIIDWDKTARENGGEPDNFYISWGTNPNNPESAEDFNKEFGNYSCVYYPVAGAYPKDLPNHVDLSKGQAAPNMPLSIRLDVSQFLEQFTTSDGVICFWDYDLDSSDDLLWTFPIDQNHLGSFKTGYYNAQQDSCYYAEWTLECIADA